MIMQRKVSNIAFTQFQRIWDKKNKNEVVMLHEFLLNLPKGESTMLKRWERLGVDCPLLVAFFTLSISLTPLLDDSRGKKERREVWEEAKAILIVKTTPSKYHGKCSKTAVSSVLCGSALSFLFGITDQTIFWYLELCLPTAVAVFYTPFCYLYSD